MLRADSVTGTADAIASACQIWMAAALCFFMNRKSHKFRITPLVITPAVKYRCDCIEE